MNSHWDWYRMAVILQMTFSNHFSWRDFAVFRLKCHTKADIKMAIILQMTGRFDNKSWKSSGLYSCKIYRFYGSPFGGELCLLIPQLKSIIIDAKKVFSIKTLDVSRILRYNANYAINGSTPKCTITSSADSNPAIQDVRKPFWPNGDKTCWRLQIQKHEQSVVVWKRMSTTCKCDIISISWNLSRKTR